MKIEILPALPEQEPVLANLLELYVHDFSAFMELELGADGRFGYQHLPLYWQEPHRYPFLVQVNGHWAGFVLLQKGSQLSAKEAGDAEIWDVTEFFIVRGYRRRDVGKQVAHQLWQRWPGQWEVRVIDRNQPAQAFWAHAIGEFLRQTIQPTPFTRNGEGWHVFSFESKRTAQLL